MKKTPLSLEFGREAFGADPAGYHAARPAYPDWVFETLRDRGCLRTHTSTFEIGAGTGIATRRLLDFGANPLIAIEPNEALANFLRSSIPDEALSVYSSTFEDAVFQEGAFDLGFSATAFHWLNEGLALEKAARLLQPGGWWGMVWNVFGDPNRADPFHEATSTLLDGPFSPAESKDNLPFALDVKTRLAAMERTRAFDLVEHKTSEWSITLDPAQTVALYSTYSNINARPDRKGVLAELGRIARDRFNGRVTRNMVTSLYIARRR